MSYTYTDELCHFGIKGMKWGVRRYQNEDGTYTELGRARRLKQGANSYSGLKRDIRSKRAKMYGSGNRWMSGVPIGEHSKRLVEESAKKRQAYKSSDEYRKWISDYKNVETDEDANEWYSKKPAKNYDDVGEWAYVYGKGFVDDYMNRGGKNLSVAYLEDLGFSNKEAKQLVDEILKQNKTLGTV